MDLLKRFNAEILLGQMCITIYIATIKAINFQGVYSVQKCSLVFSLTDKLSMHQYNLSIQQNVRHVVLYNFSIAL